MASNIARREIQCVGCYQYRNVDGLDDDLFDSWDGWADCWRRGLFSTLEKIGSLIRCFRMPHYRKLIPLMTSDELHPRFRLAPLRTGVTMIAMAFSLACLWYFHVAPTGTTTDFEVSQITFSLHPPSLPAVTV